MYVYLILFTCFVLISSYFILFIDLFIIYLYLFILFAFEGGGGGGGGNPQIPHLWDVLGPQMGQNFFFIIFAKNPLDADRTQVADWN